MNDGREALPVRRFGPPPAAFLALVAAALLLPYASYLTDDSYIHFQFAKHLLRGEGFAFNAGEPTYGATSPLWVLLLAAIGMVVPGAGATPTSLEIVPPLAAISKVVGLFATILAVIGLTRLGRRLGWSRGESAALGTMLALHAWSARWAISGMETPLAVFLIVAALDALAVTFLQEGARRATVAGLLLAAAALARPEALLLAALAAAAMILARRGGARAASASTGSGSGARLRPYALGFAIVYGAWLAIAFVLFRHVLPNTSAAKAGAWLDLARAVGTLRDSIRIMLSAEGVPVALAVLGLAFGAWETWRRLPATRRAFWLLVAAWPAALVLSFTLTGVQVVSRYLLVATPAVLLLGIAAFRHLMAAPARAPRRGAALLAAVLVHAAVNLSLTFGYSAPAARVHAEGLRTSLGSIGIWARTNTPPGTRFAVADIGAFGFYSDRPVLDLYGLVTPGMGPLTVREGYDRVVFDLRFESIGRPAYLVDRARTTARLTVAPEPDNPYRYLFARTIPNLGLTRPGEWAYSVYAIDWTVWDRLHPKLAAIEREALGGVQ